MLQNSCFLLQIRKGVAAVVVDGETDLFAETRAGVKI